MISVAMGRWVIAHNQNVRSTGAVEAPGSVDAVGCRQGPNLVRQLAWVPAQVGLSARNREAKQDNHPGVLAAERQASSVSPRFTPP